MAVMSRASTSLDLSEFLNNDDSEDHGLAEFLQNRRGVVPRRNFLLMNSEPMRLSLDVQLEKLPEKNQNNDGQEKETQEDSPTSKVVKGPHQEDPFNKNNTMQIDESSAQDSIPGNTNFRKPISPKPKVGKLSPKLSSIRKSGGVSPGDRLRRYSLSNRLSKVGGLKRTLLAEFESTISDSGFAPNVCSTPLSQETTDNNTHASKNDGDGKNFTHRVSNAAENGKSFNQGVHCCGHPETFLNCPQCNDQNIQNMVRSIVETTLKSSQNIEKENLDRANNSLGRGTSINSPLRNTYTLEKGQMPGQVILTPDVPLPTQLSADVHKNISKYNNTRSSRSSFGKTNNILNRTQNFEKRSKSPYVVSSPNARRALHDGEQNCCTVPDKSFGAEERCLVPRNSQRIGDMSNITLRTNKQMKTPESVTASRRITINVETPRIQYSPHRANLDNRPTNDAILVQERCATVMSNESQRDRHITRTPTRLRCTTSPHAVISEVEIPNTQDVNISVAYVANENDTDNEVIPETQENRPEEPDAENCGRIQPGSKNVSRVGRHEATYSADETVEISWAKKSVGAKAVHQTVQQNAVEQFEEEEDNLKLTDIMTDDEDPAPKTISNISKENDSQAPLNLAAGKSSARTKRLRKRSMSRRRLNIDHSQVMSTEAENDAPPAAHNYNIANRKRSTRKQLIPLNKAPGIPLNGEKFATELARMSNYEILDLRKRNSMGRVFPISGRKSWLKKENAIKKQIELDDEIELELLRRNMDKTNEKTPQNSQTEAIVDAELYPPVPDGFRDLTKPQEELSEMESSLVDEKSCERVSLKHRKLILGKRDGRVKKKVPEALQHYLEVPRRISQKKDASVMNNSKRALYTKGKSDCEEKSYLSETNTLENTDKHSLPHVQSPNRMQSDHMSSVIRVVSPPPPFTNQLNESQGTGFESPVERLPPPLQFESDSGIDSNIARMDRNRPMRIQSDDLVTRENTDTEDVFKVPLHPPPKTRGRKKKKTESKTNIIPPIDAQLSSFDTTDSSENGTLRRSKRGHVPLKHSAPLFQLLFQKVINRNDQIREKKRIRDKLKATLENSSSASSTISAPSHNKRKKKVVVTENNSMQYSLKKLESKTKAKTKSKKVIRKESEKQNDDTLECSRIKLSTPPPLDHFNNVFDHLRSTNVDMISDNEPTQTKMDPKGKKLKVRVARLRKKDLLIAHTNQSDDTTSRKDEVVSTSSINQITQPNSPLVSSSANTERSNTELISWLKNVTGTENTTHTEDIFNEMRISSASNLSFTELQGVEYAFYDTEDKASLGYLRFKPRQIKPKKRAKRYHLHFVTLVGNFRITANEKESIVGPGDMIAIKKSIFYDIENLSDDIGILMVVKK